MRKNSEGEIRVRCAEAERGFLARDESCDIQADGRAGGMGEGEQR